MKSILGTFQRDGQFRNAYTPGEVTSLRNAGWSPIGETEPEPTSIPVGDAVLPHDEAPAALQLETKRSHRKRKDQA